MAENILVIIIVAFVAFITGRSIFRTLTGRQGGCGGIRCRGCACGSNTGAHASGSKALLIPHDLKKM